MHFYFGLAFILGSAFSTPISIDELGDIPAAEPEYLDMLLREERYEEFNYLMDLPILSLSQPRQEPPPDDPMFNPELPDGDILYSRQDKEQARQGIRHDTNPNKKWPNRVVPYAISSSGFSSDTRNRIQAAINDWNSKVSCIKFRPRRSESAYALFFKGDGCYANLGRTGRQQSISIGNGCERHGTILHEMDHTVGFAHEHNRNDRDNNVRILWNNIPERWRSQYQKTNPRDYGLQSTYDYYSMMHYPMNAPGTNKPAFQILKNNIDQSRIGQRNGFTSTDLDKICILYR